MGERLVVRGAREHNLKDVSLDLPRDALIVFTGLSGSGKSSLAFDTIFAEGQRRYVESLSSYARQFLGQMDKPDVDFIEGLSPAVSIDQKSTSRNPRSTVGTITEVYDYLRLLYARIGVPHCPVCGDVIARQTPQQIVDQVLELPAGHPVPGAGAGGPRAQGRVRRPVPPAAWPRATPGCGSTASWSGSTTCPTLKKQEKHTIEVVVDRLTVKPESRRRLTDSVETALGLAGGLVVLEFVDLDEKDPDRERTFSEHLACHRDGLSFEELEPRSFSFNSPFGACPECTGLGTRREVDPELIVPDDELSLAEGALAPWSRGQVSDYFRRLLEAMCDELDISMDTPWRGAAGEGPHLAAARAPGRDPRPVQEPLRPPALVLHVLRGRHPLRPAPARGVRQRCQPRALRGLHARGPVRGLRGRAAQAHRPGRHGRGPQHRRHRGPADRRGRRPAARACACPSATRRSPRACSRRSTSGCSSSSTWACTTCRWTGRRARSPAARPSASGWPPRSAPGLVGVLYVLDEPSIGLHQRDNHRLIETLIRLRDLGNTLIVVEHDEDTIKTADWVVDIGPGRGGARRRGGRQRHGRRPAGQRRLDHRPVPQRPPVDRGAGDPAAAGRPGHHRAGRQRAQPARRDRVLPARQLRGGHRGERLGQVDAGQRRPLQRARPRPQRRAHRAGAAQARRRPRRRRQGRARRPEPDRPHPAQQPRDVHRRLRQHPQAVRRDARGQGPGLPAGPLLLQRQGRPVRGLLGRRHHQDRDELPARRLRAVRGLPRRPLQPRDPRGALQGPDHRPGARHAHRGGPGVLRRGPGHRPAPRDARRRRASATCAWASRHRRSAAARRSA